MHIICYRIQNLFSIALGKSSIHSYIEILPCITMCIHSDFKLKGTSSIRAFLYQINLYLQNTFIIEINIIDKSFE